MLRDLLEPGVAALQEMWILGVPVVFGFFEAWVVGEGSKMHGREGT